MAFREKKIKKKENGGNELYVRGQKKKKNSNACFYNVTRIIIPAKN